MVHFTAKKIQPQTLGEIFKKTREEAGLSLDEVCRAVQVNRKYLELLEDGDYGKELDGFYAKRVLKIYADFLNLEFVPLWKLYLKEKALWSKGSASKFVKVVSSHSLLDISKIIKICIGALVIAAMLGYLGWEVRKIFLPPYLEVINPADNLITSSSTVEVIGRTEKETQVRINGQEISSSRDGSFSESVNLKDGLNIIKISSKKEHSRENIIYRQVMVITSN